MKKYYVLLVGAMVAAAFQTRAQTKIGGSGAPDNSAMLEVTGGTGNNKGILAPRLTTAQRDAIASPATGLMIYNTSTNQLQINTGTPAAPIWSVSSGGNAWNLTGNADSNPNINYIGTADGQPLIFRTSATERMRMKSTGEIGIGTNNPQQILHVQGVARVTGSSGTSTAIMGRDGFGDIGNVSVGAGLNLAGGVLSATSGSPGWGLTGNAGTNPATNYIGTTDAQPLILRTSAAERMRITNTGNVGINNPTPRAPLSFASAQGPKIRFYDNGSDTETFGIGLGNATLNYHIDRNVNAVHRFISGGSNGDGTELMRIQSNGRVGIGTNAPQQTFHVEGTARVTGSNGTPTAITGRNATGDIGNVSVGTGLNLAAGVLSATPATPGWELAGNTGSNPNINYIGTADGQPLIFRTSATERMRMKSTGEIGIGTNNPQQILHVQGVARVTGSSGTSTTIMGRDGFGDIGNVSVGAGLNLAGGVLSATSATSGWGLTGNAGTNPATNYIGTTDAQPLILRTSAAERMRITNTGNVGINNATPRAPLSFASAQGPKIRFYDDGSDTETFGIGLGNATLNYHIDRNVNSVHRFMAGGSNDDGTELMRIQSNGRVGIGTNAPQQTLHVEGTARVTGSNGTPTAITGRDASGNIGNITLGANLSLTGGVLSASGGGGTTGWGLTGNAGTNPATNYIGTTDAQDLALRTSAIEQMRVTAAGNVGIGTNAPTAKLDITNGDIALKQTFVLRWGGETDERIYADRDLGYPGANLFMESRENMVFTIDRNNTASTSNTVGFIWSTNSSWKEGIPQELMRLTDAGNLGVGVVTPAYKLDVAGDINASASVRANGVVLTSDARLKRNISHTKHGLSTVMALNPVQYEKKNSIKDTKYDRHEIGFIAQEVAKVLPSLVTEGKDADKTLGVSYTELIPVLTKAIQEQQAQIESLKAENQELKGNQAVTAQLVERVKQMEQMMGIKKGQEMSKAVSK
ncbi:tail fiber domain-containing protein [Dyadobacter endophyticus]|uniref:tail fiber domain-containing protein n=1 Tax=Dyadobacter TaxID=120831 RepID=UPI003CEDBBBB